MLSLLASAEPTDLSGSQLLVVLICLLVIGVVGVMAAVPIAVARGRFHRRVDAVTAAAILWGLLTAASVIYFWLAKLQWDQDYRALIMTGYYAPNDTSGAPTWPWGQWIILAVTFIALILYSRSQKNPPPSSPKQPKSNGQGRS